MIKDVVSWRTFEAEWIGSQPVNYAENLRLADGMFELARTLGRFSDDDVMEGVDAKIRLAASLRRVHPAT